MNSERIADILRDRGLVTETQIQQALVRQKSRGGRIGSHLLYYRFVTEAQLVGALSDQHGVPGIALEGRVIDEDVFKRLPVEVVDEYLMLPFQYDPATNTLHVAMPDPTGGGGITIARRAARCNDLKVYVAVDSILRGLIAEHYHGRGRELFLDQIIELPPLFAEEQGTGRETTDADPKTSAPRVLMISRTAFLKNFLISIFVREGYELEMLSDPQAIAATMRNGNFEHILVAKDMEEQFAEWVRSGVLSTPRTELSIFSSVSGALLDNPAPYKAVTGTLIRALQQMADLRCAASGWKPPYVLICEDLRNLGAALGLRRLAVDGLQVAAHLLVPVGDAQPGVGGPPIPAAPLSFTNFDHSLEIAQALRFPWDVEACLASFSNLIGEITPGVRDRSHKVSLAAQILALVWYRHSAYRDKEVSIATLKADLRRQASRLAAPEVIETYARLLEQGAEPTGATSQDPVLLVSERNEVATQLSVHLKYGGYRVVEVEDLVEAGRLLERIAPRVVLVNHQHYRDHAVELCHHIKKNSNALVYAFSPIDKPSLVMDLLDAGFDDAYVPPFNFNLLVTRLGKALEMRGTAAPGGESGFRGTLRELPFVDLIQALGSSQRTVQVQLQRGNGERATVFLRGGQIVHAACGARAGADAIYRIIAWRDDGQFTTTQAANFPPDNVSQPNDSLLFEGCRQLDEARP